MIVLISSSSYQNTNLQEAQLANVVWLCYVTRLLL